MKNNVSDIKLFKDLLQYDFTSEYYDFHNDYDCFGIENIEATLIIKLKNISSTMTVFLEFYNVDIAYFYIPLEGVSGTLDTLYRGKFEQQNKLIEYIGRKGFFYLEFDNDCKFQFWADSFAIRK